MGAEPRHRDERPHVPGRARGTPPGALCRPRRARLRFEEMSARWGSFGLGMGLILAPVVLAYAAAGAILRDVALGVVVCVVTLTAREWPAARLAQAATAGWLVWIGRSSGDPAAAVVELAAGTALAVLALLPSVLSALRGQRAR